MVPSSKIRNVLGWSAGVTCASCFPFVSYLWRLLMFPCVVLRSCVCLSPFYFVFRIAFLVCSVEFQRLTKAAEHLFTTGKKAAMSLCGWVFSPIFVQKIEAVWQLQGLVRMVGHFPTLRLIPSALPVESLFLRTGWSEKAIFTLWLKVGWQKASEPEDRSRNLFPRKDDLSELIENGFSFMLRELKSWCCTWLRQRQSVERQTTQTRLSCLCSELWSSNAQLLW